MLIEILERIKEGKTYSIDEIAHSLHISAQSVKTQMEYLERCGYIKKVELYHGCQNKCRGCAAGKHEMPQLSTWELGRVNVDVS